MGFLQSNISDLLEMQEFIRYDSVNSEGRGGSRHISAVLPALSSALGTPIATAVQPNPQSLQDNLGLPHVKSAIVVLIDGLGFWNIIERKGHAPYLRSLLNQESNDVPISSCFPSTTVSALSTFGTGTCPGLTGMFGYSQINPQNEQLAQMIRFTEGLIPEEVQQEPTVFEKLSQSGMRVTTCGLPQFEDSALTRAALRGTRYISRPTPAQRVEAAAKESRKPGLTYLYIRDADKMGHQYGWDDERWIGVFERVDAQLKALKQKCAPGTLIVITADHGMINSNPDTRIDIAEIPELHSGIHLVGGEPRAVSLYTNPDVDPHDVAQRWQDILGENAMIYTREEVLNIGLYGPVASRNIAYIGDVIALASQDVTLVDSRSQTDMATHLPSVHGSMTKAEVDIPFFIDVA